MGTAGAVAESDKGDAGGQAVTRLRFALLYVAAWIPFACIWALLIFAQSGGGERTLDGAIAGSLWSTISAAVLGLGVWQLTRRLIERGARASIAIAAHAAA